MACHCRNFIKLLEKTIKVIVKVYLPGFQLLFAVRTRHTNFVLDALSSGRDFFVVTFGYSNQKDQNRQNSDILLTFQLHLLTVHSRISFFKRFHGDYTVWEQLFLKIKLLHRNHVFSAIQMAATRTRPFFVQSRRNEFSSLNSMTRIALLILKTLRRTNSSAKLKNSRIINIKQQAIFVTRSRVQILLFVQLK